MKETYDNDVNTFRFYKGQRCYLFDPVAKVGKCFNIWKKWRGPYLINKISSHNVFLYNPSTDKYIEKSVYINHIKPCYQHDDVPEDDEDIEDLPIVEVTYPTIGQAPTSFATSQPTNRTQYLVQKTETRASASIQTRSTDSPMTAQQPAINDQNSTSAQRNSTPSDDQTKSDQFWNALKIVRQRNVKGNPRYFLRWEDLTAPDSWADDINVSEELKKVFYLTHTPRQGQKDSIYWKTPRTET